MDKQTTYIFGLVLLSGGATLLFFLVAPALRAIWTIARDGAERKKLLRGEETLKRVDQLLEQQDLRSAVRLLRTSVVLETLSDRDSIRGARDHNQSVLSRFVDIAAEQGIHFDNLAELEQLFIEQSELQILLSKANDTFQKLQTKREKERKVLPEWTKSDFERRSQEIAKEIKVNRASLEQALDALVYALESPKNSNVTYH